MAENTQQGATSEKSSPFKQAFQWASAFCGALVGNNPNVEFANAGYAYDYVKTYIGAHSAPKGPQIS